MCTVRVHAIIPYIEAVETIHPMSTPSGTTALLKSLCVGPSRWMDLLVQFYARLINAEKGPGLFGLNLDALKPCYS